MAFSETDQVRVPAPALLMVSVCAPGLLPPCTPVNEKFVALSPMVGVGAAVIETVTPMTWGVLVAPVAEIATLPLYVPTESPLVFAPTVNEPLFVPDTADPPFILSQGAVDVAVQLRVPVPLFVIVTDWFAGLAPF